VLEGKTTVRRAATWSLTTGSMHALREEELVAVGGGAQVPED
jgi:hypothetical protein